MLTLSRALLLKLSVLFSLAAGWGAGAHAQLASYTVQSEGKTGELVSFDGVVEAVRQTSLSAQVSGAIVALSVKAGDRVKAGQEIARIDARAALQNASAALAQVEVARAALLVATRELERQQQLFAQQYISQAALDRVQAQAQVAQAQLKAVQAQTEASQTQARYFVVRAPYAAVVSDVLVSLGDMAMPGRALAVVHDDSALRVSAAVPQGAVPGGAMAMHRVLFEIPGLANARTAQAATAVQVLPTADPWTHTAQLRLGLPASLKGAAPGMFARVWLPQTVKSDFSERVYVPVSTVVRRAEMTGVYALDAKGRALLRQVRVGVARGDRVEILSGVQRGDRLALDPQAAARVR